MRLAFSVLVLGAVLSSESASSAQPGFSQPPRIEPPIGVSRDTVLPGQRDGVPVFSPPKLGERGAADPAQAPVTTAPPNATTPLPPRRTDGLAAPRQGYPAQGYPSSNASVSEPDRWVPEMYQQPRGPNPYHEFASQTFAGNFPASGNYYPGGMEGPASFAPFGGPTPGQGSFDQALRSPPSGWDGCCGYGGACGHAGGCCDSCCSDPFWFATFGGLYMGRNSPNRMWTTAQKSNYFNQIMNGADATGDWIGGWEGSIGRFFPCWGAIQFTYWGLAPIVATDSVVMPGDLVTPINLNDVYIGGVGADFFFDNAEEHRIRRRDEINNIELNFLGLPAISSGGCLQVNFLAGVRYFRFRDQFIFGAVREGFQFGSDGGVNEAYLDVALNNSMIGGQLGALANWFITPRWGIFCFPRAGVFVNEMTQHFQVYRGDGLRSIDIGTHKTVGSILAQIDIGVNYFFTPNWSVYLGYRVMGVSGVGLADQQIPPFLIDTPEIEAIDSNSNLILQGITAGLLWRF